MASTVVTNYLKTFFGKYLISSLADSSIRLYVFFAKIDPWENDNVPPDAVASPQEIEYDLWHKMTSAKKIVSTDITFVAPRHDWVANTVYDEYQSVVNNDDNIFYVLTDDRNVYKCLYNKTGGLSTVKPTGTSQYAVTTSDGYIWKYMYTVTSALALKYLTRDWIPIQTLTANSVDPQWTVQTFAANGSIEVIDMVQGGANYQTATGSLVSANDIVLFLPDTASSVDNIYNGSDIYLTTGTGAGQIRKVIDYNGVDRRVRVGVAFAPEPDATTHFNIGPRVVVTGDGANSAGYSVVSNNQITQIIVIDRGKNYSWANVSFEANNGSGASANAYISPKGGHGSDPINELGGVNLMLNVKVNGGEANTFSVTNDFRQVGVVMNPLLANGVLATQSTYHQYTEFLYDSFDAGDYEKDEYITGLTSNASAQILEQVSIDTLRVIDVRGTFANGEHFISSITDKEGIINGINSPELLPYSGQIISFSNRSPILRDNQQIEDIKIILAN